jgi:hypothetical protein
LEKNVLRNVRLKTMKFTHAGDSKIKVELSGVALNYDALSKQSDAFGSENLRPYISQPVISDFNPTPEGGVSFSFTALVDPKLVSYRNIISEKSAPATDSGSVNTEVNVSTSTIE